MGIRSSWHPAASCSSHTIRSTLRRTSGLMAARNKYLRLIVGSCRPVTSIGARRSAPQTDPLSMWAKNIATYAWLIQAPFKCGSNIRNGRSSRNGNPANSSFLNQLLVISMPHCGAIPNHSYFRISIVSISRVFGIDKA